MAAREFDFPEGLDLEDKVAYAIGCLVMEWGITETLFYGVLEALAGRRDTENATVVWLSNRDNRGRIELITKLAKVQNLGPVAPDEIVTLCKRFRAVTKVRNFFCHATYDASAGGELLGVEGFQLTDNDDPVGREYRPLSQGLVNEIVTAIQDAKRLNIDMWRFMPRLKAALGVQHPTLPPELQEYLDRVDPQPRPDTDAAQPSQPKPSED
jgi:hypothetical protein